MKLPPISRASFQIALCGIILLGGVAAAGEPGESLPLKQGDAINIDGHRAVLTTLDTLPYVDDQYTRRFKFDSYDNPKLSELRQRYHLDQVVAPGKTEFERQVLLVDWVNHRFKKFGKPSSIVRGALEILPAVDSGGCFFCTQYGEVMISAAASLGWVDRPLALRRPDNRGSGSTEHTSTEIWSNQYRKWVVLDPTSPTPTCSTPAPTTAGCSSPRTPSVTAPNGTSAKTPPTRRTIHIFPSIRRP